MTTRTRCPSWPASWRFASANRECSKSQRTLFPHKPEAQAKQLRLRFRLISWRLARSNLEQIDAGYREINDNACDVHKGSYKRAGSDPGIDTDFLERQRQHRTDHCAPKADAHHCQGHHHGQAPAADRLGAELALRRESVDQIAGFAAVHDLRIFTLRQNDLDILVELGNLFGAFLEFQSFLPLGGWSIFGHFDLEGLLARRD